MSNPFSNPFSTASNDAAPTPRVTSAPLASAKPVNPNYVASAHPSPVVVSSIPPVAAPATTGQIYAPPAPALSAPVGGSAKGWSAVGGSPVVVGEGENADALSRRYGVPSSALLSANGLSSASQIHSGMRIVVPVYNAGGKTAATPIAPASAPSTKPHKPEMAEADAPKPTKAKAVKAIDSDDSSDDDAPAKKPLAKTADAKLAPGPHALTKPDKAAAKAKDVADATPVAKPVKPTPAPVVKAAPAAVAKADAPAKPSAKKPDVDKAPTAAINPGAALATAAPVTAKEADASGATPEFRWPARGRIIQGFKSGGNDGINISVPEGTSVRAAEDGKVAYAGNALKGYGNLVLIRHPNGFVSAYANNGELNVKNGETVKRGQVIAKSGQSGDVSSPQLHFELRKGSTPVDPTSYLAGI